MSAKDKLTVTKQSQISRRSQRAFEAWVDPWLFTAVDQRDDYGRDGFVQIVDRIDGRDTASPLTFAVQLKAHASPFRDTHSEPLETRHLALWTDRLAPSTLVVVWSEADDQIRCRTAREILDELALHAPKWRDQSEVSAQFRNEHTYRDVGSRLAALRSRIADETDRAGGISSFHRDRPRVILTDLFNVGRVTTSSNLTLSDGRRLFIGPGWMDGDLDNEIFSGQRVLAGALLLYEEVWFQYNHTDCALALLGPDLFIALLHTKRIVPYVLQEFVGFELLPGQVRGRVNGFVVGESVLDVLGNHVRQYASILAPGHLSIANEILRHTVLTDDVRPAHIINETRRDLGQPRLRTLLGLSSHHMEGSEAAWDWPLVNRLIHINTARAVAAARKIDVIEYEGAGSRLASEKWYSDFDFHRLFPTSSAFDAALRANGIPDLGMLVSQIGLAGCISLSNSDTGRDFRAWFWSVAVDLLASGADLKTSLTKAVSHSIGGRADASRLAMELKLAYWQQVGSDYLVGVPIARTASGISSRSSQPDGTLKRQRQNHLRRRPLMMKELLSLSAPERNDRCPCRSGAKFKACCGAGVS